MGAPWIRADQGVCARVQGRLENMQAVCTSPADLDAVQIYRKDLGGPGRKQT